MSDRIYACRVRVYSHCFSVHRPTYPVRRAITELCNGLVHWVGTYKAGRYVKQPGERYYAYIQDRDEWRFSIHMLEDFKARLCAINISDHDIHYEVIPPFEHRHVDHIFTSTKSPRENQLDTINYIMDDTNPQKLVEAATGTGKTYMTMYGSYRRSTPIVYIILPRFINKTIKDLKGEFDIGNGDIVAVKGSDQLAYLTQLGKADKLDAKFIIISLSTYIAWIRSYINNPEGIKAKGFACSPIKFFETIKSNMCVIDECHMQFGAVFMTTLFMHVKWTIFMSATLSKPEDAFITKMYQYFYPARYRIKKLVPPPYLKAHKVRYRIGKPEYIRCKERGSEFYSHNAFEESIRANKKLFNSYMEVIAWIMELKWTKLDRPKVLLIYFTSIEFIDAAKAWLEKRYPDYVIKRKVAEDPIENAHSADIVLSTIGSLGTGHDIFALKAVICAISVSASQTNQQVYGRLREQDDGNHDFYYLYSEQIAKQKEYADQKEELLKPVTVENDVFFFPYEI